VVFGEVVVFFLAWRMWLSFQCSA